MNIDGLTAAIGALFSILFTYVPGLNEWYAKQMPWLKILIMAGAGIVLPALMWVLACYAGIIFPNTQFLCGGWDVFKSQVFDLWISWMMGNQFLYIISPKPNAVRIAKASRDLPG